MRNYVHAHPVSTSELKIYIKLRGDLGMSEKAKKQVVSALDQYIFGPSHFLGDLHF